MGIIRTDVVGDVRVQADDSRRGTVEFEFDDGRIVQKNLRATDATAWANLLVDIVSEVEADFAAQDAEAASQTDDEINDAEAGQATREELAVAYLRNAHGQELPLDAWKKYDKFNNYRISKGWNLNQVVVGLASASMTQAEWDIHLQLYQQLNNASRLQTMQDYQVILGQWDNREDLP